MSLDILLALYAGLLGLVVGSYLNVVIYRVPRGEPTVAERSRCPHCGHAIRPWHNIPVFGYLLLRGHCRDCGAPIHWRYPVVEALVGVLFLACYRIWGASLPALAGALFCSLLVALAAIDVEHLILPDRLTLPGIALGLVLQPWLPWTTVTGALVGSLLGAGVVVAIGGTWRLLHGTWGLGLGDAKLLAMVGAFLGWQGVVMTFALGSLLGTIVAAVGALAGKLSWGSRLPFGAFLAAAALVALLVGSSWAASFFGSVTDLSPIR